MKLIPLAIKTAQIGIRNKINSSRRIHQNTLLGISISSSTFPFRFLRKKTVGKTEMMPTMMKSITLTCNTGLPL